ncbi:MAG: hypothetical protein KY455_13150 [Euryarchaeota archaeon]|nr:hypothetical protein [Euryarchaeota archaeon]
MVKFTGPFILSAIVTLLGVFFFVGAVAGLLFAAPTPATDIGLYAVTVTLLALGLLGMWASVEEQKTH